MQDITPALAANAQLIQSYGPTGFRIGNTQYASAVLVLTDATVAWSGELTIEALAPLLSATPKPDILLLGTGARHEMVSPELKNAIKAQGIALDTMDTGAACRTFNVLLGEGRRAAVALRLPV